MFDTDAVKERLKSFGYEVKADDEFALTFCVEKIRNTIKNEINWTDVPEGLEHIAVDMAAAILSVPAIQFGQYGDNALLIETEFGDDVMIGGYFILMPDPESYVKTLTSKTYQKISD